MQGFVFTSINHTFILLSMKKSNPNISKHSFLSLKFNLLFTEHIEIQIFSLIFLIILSLNLLSPCSSNIWSIWAKDNWFPF